MNKDNFSKIFNDSEYGQFCAVAYKEELSIVVYFYGTYGLTSMKMTHAGAEEPELAFYESWDALDVEIIRDILETYDQHPHQPSQVGEGVNLETWNPDKGTLQ